MREILAKGSISVLELHGQGSLSRESREIHLLQANPHQSAVLDLSPSLDELWRKVLHHKVRNTVRQAENCNLHVWQECSPQTIKEVFYPLYLKTMRRLGVPPHSVKYFLRCHSGLGERLSIFWAAKDGLVIAALLGFSCGGRVNVTTTVSDEISWEYRPNDLLFWSYIKWAKERNMRYFDFGSVRYAGQMQYKKKWGCSFSEHAYYLLHSARHQSETRVLNSSGDAMKKFSTIWSRYVPDSMGRAIGPVLRKHLVR
jgi:lipid II:glycine glycyltransferase (peptidoglycan interpeptide bridge formation enzyme)